MKKMTYKNLMKKCEEGMAEVTAWSGNSGNFALVSFYKSNGTCRRETVEVTNIPAEVQS